MSATTQWHVCVDETITERGPSEFGNTFLNMLMIRTYYVWACVFARSIGNNKGDLIDILALINSGINFILYCSMSRQFRKTFIVLFRPKFMKRWLSLDDDENPGAGHTYIGRDENNGLTTQVTQV